MAKREGPNIGEINELLLQIFLVYLRDQSPETETPFGKIISVGLDKEYNSLDYEIDFSELEEECGRLLGKVKLVGFERLYKILNDLGIEKSQYKADVIINGEPVSTKFFGGANPALVNHTSREKWVRIADEIDYDISILDRLINEYWSLLEQGIFTEDINNSESNSPFYNSLEDLRPLLNYFAFKGTGTKLSEIPANAIMDYKKFNNIDTWEILREDNFLEFIWNRLIFSLRSSKGMPKNYNNCKNKKTIAPWTRKRVGLYKGALHIRISK